MPINQQDVDLALTLFKGQDEKIIFSGEIGYFHSAINVDLSTMKKENLRFIGEKLRYLNQHLWNIYVVAHRIKWIQLAYQKEKINETLWLEYAQTDINQFHIEFRSALDYIAQMIRAFPPSPFQTPNSFNELMKGKDNKYIEKLDGKIKKILDGITWFNEIKDLRDLSVHKGGFTLVFGTTDRITFQTYNGWAKQVNRPELMYNKNIVDFELYAGMYLAYLHALIERICIEGSRLFCLRFRPIEAYTTHPGLPIVYDWIKQVKKIES